MPGGSAEEVHLVMPVVVVTIIMLVVVVVVAWRLWQFRRHRVSRMEG
jgi:heme/copper-type cytochrome/quinol oxidase subunit 2